MDRVSYKKHGGWLPVSRSYLAAVAYQATFRHLEIRLGIGLSAIPHTWATSAFDVSWRFGGATRGEARKMKLGWRSNKRDLQHGGDAPPGTVLPEKQPPS